MFYHAMSSKFCLKFVSLLQNYLTRLRLPTEAATTVMAIPVPPLQKFRVTVEPLELPVIVVRVLSCCHDR